MMGFGDESIYIGGVDEADITAILREAFSGKLDLGNFLKNAKIISDVRQIPTNCELYWGSVRDLDKNDIRSFISEDTITVDGKNKRSNPFNQFGESSPFLNDTSFEDEDDWDEVEEEIDDTPEFE